MQTRAQYIYREIYKPRLKIVDFDYADGKIIIYSHAPCDLQAIQFLSGTTADLIASINTINGNINNLIQTYCNDPSNSQLSRFVWNRDLNKRFYGTYVNVFGHVGEANISTANQINLDTDSGRHEEYLLPNQPNPAKCTNGNLKILQVAPAAATKDETTQNLIAKIKSAVMVYTDWFNQRISKNWFSCRSSIGLFNRHGDDGQRRAAEVLRRSYLETNINGIKKVLQDFANNKITKDEMKRTIGGSVRANPHSFISYLLNELKTDDNLWNQLLPTVRFIPCQQTQIDFTQDNQIANVVRSKILAMFKNPS